MKKRILALMAAALFLGAGAGTSYAYLTAQDDVENTFGGAQIEIGISEEFEPVEDLEPNQIITKAPRVVSGSDADCYVRMMAHFSDDQAERFCEPLAINSGWILRDDGYYYWDDAVAPGTATGTLFDQVRIKENADPEELCPFEILVYAEAVQCAGLTLEDAWRTMDLAG